jgi:hypothetical protein
LKKCTALRYLYQVPGLCVCRRRRVASAAGWARAVPPARCDRPP